MRQRMLFLLFLFCFSAGCAGQKALPGHVDHVILVWLKDSGNKEAIRKVVETTRELREIEGILALHVGEAIPSERDIVDDSFDVGIVMTFSSGEVMNRYLRDKRHVERVQKVFKPMASKILVYDIAY